MKREPWNDAFAPEGRDYTTFAKYNVGRRASGHGTTSGSTWPAPAPAASRSTLPCACRRLPDYRLHATQQPELFGGMKGVDSLWLEQG